MAEIDAEVAERLARERLVESLLTWSESERSDMALLAGCVMDVTRAIERGEPPDKKDVEEARVHLRSVEQRLDDLSAFHGWSRWETGVAFGRLSEEEREAIPHREERTDA